MPAGAPAADAAGGGEGAHAPSSLTPSLTLRALTLDDFLCARAVVRPTRGRFAGVHHDVHGAAPPPPADLDDDLYN